MRTQTNAGKGKPAEVPHAPPAPEPLRMLTIAQACERWGISPSYYWKQYHDGLLPPPITKGARIATKGKHKGRSLPAWSRVPSDEVTACMRLMIAGASDDERRALVQRLLAERELNAQEVLRGG
jgi:hypothetical protein